MLAGAAAAAPCSRTHRQGQHTTVPALFIAQKVEAPCSTEASDRVRALPTPDPHAIPPAPPPAPHHRHSRHSCSSVFSLAPPLREQAKRHSLRVWPSSGYSLSARTSEVRPGRAGRGVRSPAPAPAGSWPWARRSRVYKYNRTQAETNKKFAQISEVCFGGVDDYLCFQTPAHKTRSRDPSSGSAPLAECTLRACRGDLGPSNSSCDAD